MTYFVYALFNSRADRLYVGQTNDLERRLLQHNQKLENKSKYTKSLTGNWLLFYKEEYVARKDALRREKALKSHQGRVFLRGFLANKRP